MKNHRQRDLWRNTPRIAPYFLLGVFIVGFTVALRPNASLTGDALEKFVQSISLHRNHYVDDTLIYPARPVDPQGEHVPFYFVSRDGSLRTVFPVLSAVLSAPAAVLGGPLGVALFGACAALLALWILHAMWGLAPIELWITAIATPLLLHSAGFVDVALANLVALSALGLIFRAEGMPGRGRLFWGGFLLASAVWFRMEAIPLSMAVAFVLIVPVAQRILVAKIRTPSSAAGNTSSPRNDPVAQTPIEGMGGEAPVGAFGLEQGAAILLGMSVGFACFFAFHAFVYGHPLGIRFMANREQMFGLPGRPEIVLRLLLGGEGRVGFFGYTPLFLFALLYAMLPGRVNRLSAADRSLAGCVVVFVVLVAATAPNGGNIDWGTRYLSLAVLPIVILVSRSIHAWRDDRRAFWVAVGLVLASCAFSISITYRGHKVVRRSGKQLALAQRELNATPADILVLENLIACSHLGRQYLTRPALLFQNTQKLAEVMARVSRWKGMQSVALVYFPVPTGFSGESLIFTFTGERKREFERIMRAQFGPPQRTIRGATFERQVYLIKHPRTAR